MSLLDVLLSLATSIIGSALVWWILNRMLVPKIELSKNIACVSAISKPHKKVFKIAVTNLSKRDAFDVILQGRFVIFGTNENTTEEPYYYVARVGTGSHPYLPRYQNADGVSKHNSRRFRVKPSKPGIAPIAILCNIDEKNVNVESILHANLENYLEVVVTCTHSSSSARKITRQIYYHDNIEQSESTPDEGLETTDNEDGEDMPE